jgi:hypothetical protein
MTKRRVFTIGSGFSMLLCLGIIALWVRSVYYFDDFGSFSPRRYWHVTSVQGQVCFRYLTSGSDLWESRTEVVSGNLKRVKYNLGQFNWRLLGVGYSNRAVPSRSGPLSGQMVLVPHWLLALAAAVLPIMWFKGWRGRRLADHRATEGLCRKCGYDLRATPDRCPECGRQTHRISLLRVLWDRLLDRRVHKISSA